MNIFRLVNSIHEAKMEKVDGYQSVSKLSPLNIAGWWMYSGKVHMAQYSQADLDKLHLV